MEPHVKYTLVGIVMLVLIASMSFAIFWVSQDGEDQEQRIYSIYFRNFSLSGLQENSYVTMRGIRVGTVANLQISRRDVELIKVLISIDADTPVKTSTRAVVNRNILTGLAQIDLVHTSQDAPFLQPSPTEEYPVIPEGETPLGALQESLPQMLERAGHVVDRIDRVLSDENIDALSATIQNVRSFTEVVLPSEEEARQARSSLNALLNESREAVRDLHAGGLDAAKAIKDAADSVKRSTSQIGGAVRQAESRSGRAFEKLENPRKILTGPGPNELGPGE